MQAGFLYVTIKKLGVRMSRNRQRQAAYYYDDAAFDSAMGADDADNDDGDGDGATEDNNDDNGSNGDGDDNGANGRRPCCGK